MKRLSCCLLLLTCLWLFIPCAFTLAQATNPATPSNIVTPLAPAVQPPAKTDQWASHQMNQPPPETGDKYSFSPGLVDEIKDLYLQAKREYEAKAARKSPINKHNTQKTGNAVKGKP